MKQDSYSPEGLCHPWDKDVYQGTSKYILSRLPDEGVAVLLPLTGMTLLFFPNYEKGVMKRKNTVNKFADRQSYISNPTASGAISSIVPMMIEK